MEAQIKHHFANTNHLIGATVVLWINHLPCKPGVVGLIHGFSSLSDEICSYPHVTLTVGGMLNTNTLINSTCQYRLLITFANSLNPGQAQHKVGPDLDSN